MTGSDWKHNKKQRAEISNGVGVWGIAFLSIQGPESTISNQWWRKSINCPFASQLLQSCIIRGFFWNETCSFIT